MTDTDIRTLIERRAWPGRSPLVALYETHISWVIVTADFAWKIKKPVRFSFLDFSALERRKHFCQREVVLNNRLSHGIYLGVVPVRQGRQGLCIGGAEGEIVDYAVQMKTLPAERRMDLMVRQGQVNDAHVRALAEVLAGFHHRAQRVPAAPDALALYADFADILQVKEILEAWLDPIDLALVVRGVAFAKNWLDAHDTRLAERHQMGWVVDGHGDLHTRNIFLLDRPVVFDCIEFNDELRHLDVLNEMAFLGMDLNFLGHPELERRVLHYYLLRLPCIESETDWQLYRFFKWYRANVRLKVAALAMKDVDPAPQQLQELRSYARMYVHYYEQLKKGKS